MSKKRVLKKDDISINQLEPSFNFRINPLKFKNEKQKQFYDLCRNRDIKLLICDGPAGTGKSTMAIYSALKDLKAGYYEKLLYVRSPVHSSAHEIGFLPGDINDKIINYMLPLDEKISKLVSPEDVKELYRQGKIEYAVNSFIRGRSIDNTIIVIDEIQNFTMHECKSLFSRTEETAKIIAIGDHMQSDIGLKSCLTKLLLMFKDDLAIENGISTFEFDNNDIVRSKLTKYIVETFEKYEKIGRN